tara:strand:+ start:997 stop:2076 length:1080 start_codon:yes stop_codon:yes gene_type:complete
MLAFITRFAALAIALAILTVPAHEAQAQSAAVCKAKYQDIFDRIGTKDPNVRRVSDAEISWALDYEKAVNAGEPCPPMPAAVRATAPQAAVAPRPAAQVQPRQDPFDEGLAAHNAGQYAAALGHFEKSCAQGSGAGCWNAGMYHYGNFGTTKNWAKALQFWIEGCGYENLKSCRKSAMMARDGQGGPVDYQLAEANGQIGCSLGEGDSCTVIANLRRFGQLNGGDGSWREALPFFEKGCSLDAAESCFRIADLLRKGYQDYPKDLDRALKLYAKTCFLDYQAGCNTQALMLAAGEGTPKDEARARRILKSSCDRMYAIACSNLAAYYEKGRGGPVDLAKAREAADLACKYGWKLRCPKE